jgi:hypothetical protein
MSKKISTYFIPSKLSNEKQIFADVKLIYKARYIKALLDSIPNTTIILNKNYQMVFGNGAYFEDFTSETYSNKIGLRPGDLLGCIHGIEDPGGCGTTRYCKYCGFLAVILKSQKTGNRAQGEARISSDINKETSAYDFMVTASPLTIKSKPYTLVTLNDISSEKRKEALERIFFHDLLNKAGGLSWFFENIKFPSGSGETKSMIEIAANLSSEIVEEINVYRSIMEAETGELNVVWTDLHSEEVIENVVKQINCHTVSYEKHIKILPESEKVTILTDYYLLNRILMNMLKNALEATSRNGTVTISCRRIDNSVRFSVHNDRVMDENVSQQVFQRSFSTKGSGRGLGTYSMKLLGERYLNGKISFESKEEKGTTFWVDIPYSE